MRGVAILLLLAGSAGCGGNGTPQCTPAGGDCGADVCARDGECLPPNDVRMVKVTWTIHGMAASDTTCATTPSFYLEFDGSMFQDTFGYEPVPCDEGQFSIDKIPTRFGQVDLGVDGSWTESDLIDPTGNATFDLP